MLPEEEPTAEDAASPPPDTNHRLAPTHYPNQQAHSFESYLLPDDDSHPTNVRRQMSDPTPSPEIHPISRRSSRSTCRPLQIQSTLKQDMSDENYFKFPDVVQKKDAQHSDNAAGDKTTLVKFINDNKHKGEENDECVQRVKSPTFGILQNTVSQLITISQDYAEAESYIAVENVSNGVRTRQTLVIPSSSYPVSNGGSNSPYKTPTENSAFSSPGFYTPRSDVSDNVKKSSAEASSSSSSSFQTPSNTSPDIVSSVGDVSKSAVSTTMSYKTALDGSYCSTMLNTPVLASPDKKASDKQKRHSTTDVTEVTLVMDVDSLDKRNTLYVKPIKQEVDYNKFDRNRTMLSILIDSPRDQKQHFKNKDLDLNENNTSIMLKETTTSAVPNLMSPNEGNTTSSPTSVSTVSSLSPETATTTLSRVPSKRKLTRSLARVSSQTVFELVGPR